MVTSLVTGAAGFLGSHVCDHLINMGHQVIPLDDMSGGNAQSARGLFVEASYGAVQLMQRLFNEYKFDYVFHLGAYASEGLSHHIRQHIYLNNVVGSANLINAAVNAGTVKRFVFTSSVAVYGHRAYRATEHDNCEPIDPYGIGKLATELDLRAAHEYYGLPYTIFRPHNCYDDQTEVLTENGFKLFSEVDKDERVATLNPSTHAIEYHVPVAYQEFNYRGPMYHFASRLHDFRVTPDHKVWCKRTPRSDWGFETAESIANDPKAYSARVSRKATWQDGIAPYSVTIPAVKDKSGRSMTNSHQNGAERYIDPKLWSEFIGWYVTEGCRFKTSMNYVVSISQYKSVNPENYQRIVELVRKMGFSPYLTGEKEIRVFSKQLYEYLECCGDGAHHKHVPHNIKQWNTDLLRILYESMMSGDGNKSGDRFNTVSRQLADDFCEVALKIGKSTTTSWEDGRLGGIYRVSVCDGDTPQLGDNKTKRVNVTCDEYDGAVYDLTVQNHIIFVRRNGRGCWSSNCFGPRQNMNDPYRNVVAIFIRQCLAGEPMTIYGDGLQTRCFTYVDDVAASIAKCVELPVTANETYNIGSPISITILELAQEVAKACGVECHYRCLPERKEASDASPSHVKYQRDFDAKMFTSLQYGLAQMVEWARQQPKGKPMRGPAIEVTRNLPEGWRTNA